MFCVSYDFPPDLLKNGVSYEYVLTRMIQGREKRGSKFDNGGMTDEELLRMQEEAFRDAAQRHG